MKNLGLKGLSLLIALLLSYFVNREENSTVFTFMAPVEVRDLPAGKVLEGSDAMQVQVTIRGPSFVLSRIPASPPVFRISAAAMVEERIELRGADLALPPYVQVVSIQPREIKLALDDLADVSAVVKAPLLGPVAGDYKVDAVVVSPDAVQVKGPGRKVGALSNIQTEPVDVRDARKSVAKVVPLRLPEGALSVTPAEVSVQVKITPIEVSRTYDRLAVEVRTVGGENYAIAPPMVSVEVQGRRELLEKLDRDHVIPYVRLGKEESARSLSEVGVDLPEGLSVGRVDPARVEVIRSGLAGRRGTQKGK